jgi:phage FluMu gp28-like protein
MTGVGNYVCEDMKAAGIPNLVGVNFTMQSKEGMAVPFKQAMINGLIRIPYDRDLIAELNIERFEMGRDGHYRFSHPENTHDDRFWSVVLAYNASREETFEVRRGKGFKW